MTNTIPRSLLLIAGTLAIAVPGGASAQEFFRDYGTSRTSSGFGPVAPSEYSYEDSSPSGLRPLRPGQDLTAVEEAEEDDRYNFAIGPVHFGIAAGIGIEFNDNITFSDDDRISDFVLRPILDLGATWRLSELNTLRFDVGVSYAKYLEHSEYDTDGVLVSPSSELALTFFLGQIEFTVRDRLSYQEDPYDIPTLSDVAVYGRWENQAGIAMDWGINESVNLIVGYDHYNLWTTGDDFRLQDRAIDTLYIRPGVQLTPAVKVGLSASLSYIAFEDDARSDGEALLVGPFVQWQVSEYTNIYLEAGFQEINYDDASNYNDDTIVALGLDRDDAAAVREILQDTDNSSTYYIKLEINNRPAENFSHRLSFSKTTEIGFTSNFFDLYHVEYNADWKCLPNTEIGPIFFYEHYTTSNDFGETANRFGAAFGVRHHLSNSLTLGLDYRFILKESDVAGADYYQNLAFLSLYYKF
ncbi:MAG: hypothetical protein H7Y20_07305 [Bryobacteraceae bacterium]|nr:hypothetical protein [Bryobacteraceae bacterium]